jgi:hypothetical protein
MGLSRLDLMKGASVGVPTNDIDISQTFGFKKRIAKVEHAIDVITG